MLKSTYKPASVPPPLPVGWTEHKAPTGKSRNATSFQRSSHPYYYNTATQQSTYTRPTEAPPLTASRSPSEAHSGLTPGFDHGISHLNSSYAHVAQYQSSVRDGGGRGHGGPVEKYHERSRPAPADRPKTKHTIPGCSPWLLVETKLGRRFVHNPDTEESLWKFPLEVMKGVVEYDRLEREKKAKTERDARSEDEYAEPAGSIEKPKAMETAPSGTSIPPTTTTAFPNVDNDSDEYEEVEVTDEEEEATLSKRQKTEEGYDEQPVEFNEDDIAYQLAAMGQDYGLDPGEYGEYEDVELEEGTQGLPLTEEDSNALFKDMLNDLNISPYTTWEKIIEAGQVVEDDRYTVLPNMKSRKEVWGDWSRQRIQQLKEQREQEVKKDPRIPYLAFLQKHGTPKLYWPEFRRKYKRDSEMRDSKLTDKDREKWYRDYINRLKLPESTLKADLASLLKFLPLHVLNRSTSLDALPPAILTDIRYISLRAPVRDPIIEAHISALPPPPTDLDVSPEEHESRLKRKNERERRERALADRQARVEETKRKQKGTLNYSKEMLRVGKDEVERAKNVGKEGLLGYLEQDNPARPASPADS